MHLRVSGPFHLGPLVQWGPYPVGVRTSVVLLALTKMHAVILLVAYVLWVARGINHGDCNARSLSSAFKDSVLRGMVVPPAAALYNLKRVEARTTAGKDVSLIDGELLNKELQSGGVYVQDDFLPGPTLLALQQDIRRAEEKGQFKASGLSNKALVQQAFNEKNDRAVCPVLLGSSAYHSETLEKVMRDYLVKLRSELARELNRPTMMNDDLEHELYYSRSSRGSSLQRHVDERHPELSLRGYTGVSRRSVSFLLYLSEVKGGQLRTFPQKGRRQALGGSVDNCMQVAWLVDKEHARDGLKPVFLDSWKRTSLLPVCELFTVRGDFAREPISVPFDISGGAMKTLMRDLKPVLLPQFRDHRYTVTPIEELATEVPLNSRVLDISPRPNRIVAFDSIMLPHEVRTVQAGTRLALAGWFHEASPPIPALSDIVQR